VPPLRGLLPLVVLLVVLQLVLHGQSAYFPRPSLWWEGIQSLAKSGALWPALAATLKSFGLALAVATVIGTALGIAIGASQAFDRTLGPLLDFCRFMPAAAIVPVAVLFAGYSEKMTLIVVVFSAVWPILLQVRASVRTRSPLLHDVARSLHLSPARGIWKVLLPSTVPAIILGVRVAAPIVLIVVLLVEIVTQIQGLGALISDAQRTFDAATAYGLLAIAGIIGIAINVLVALAEGWFSRHEARVQE